MRPSHLDTAIHVAIYILAAFEGVAIAAAAINAVDPMAVVRDTQTAIIAAFAALGATLAFRSAMAKVWLDSDLKEAERHGIAASLKHQFLLQAYLTYDVYIRLTRGSRVFAEQPVIRKRTLNEIGDLINGFDDVTKNYRDVFRYVHPDEMVDVLDKYVGFTALVTDLRMAHELLSAWDPKPEDIAKDLKGVHYLLTLLGQKIMQMAFKYDDDLWDKWEAELGETLDKRDAMYREWFNIDSRLPTISEIANADIVDQVDQPTDND